MQAATPAHPMTGNPPTGPAAQANAQGLRVLVVGTSGAGKSTFARDLAARLQAPHIELDALHWGPGWAPRPQFLDDVRAAAASEDWVCDGNYRVARSTLWPRATHVVWLNYPRRVVWWRVLWRTLTRGIGRQPLWAGNRESLRMAFFSKDSILWWSLTTFGKNRREHAQLRSGPQWPQLQWLVLHHPREADAALARLARLGAARRAKSLGALGGALNRVAVTRTSPSTSYATASNAGPSGGAVALARLCQALQALAKQRGAGPSAQAPVRRAADLRAERAH